MSAPTAKTTKGELVARVAGQSGASAATVEQVLTALVDAIGAELAAGASVTLPGLGTFETRDRAAREGRNPRTGETLHIAATRTAAFKASAPLRRRVSGVSGG